MLHHFIKYKSFDEILNANPYEKAFLIASMEFEREEKANLIKTFIKLLGGELKNE